MCWFIICNFLDSNKDLPERWFEISLDAFREPEDDAGPTSDTGVTSDGMTSDGMTSDGVMSDGGMTSDGVMSDGGSEIDLQRLQNSLMPDQRDPVQDITSLPLPQRVLVFTTVKLLGLLALCKHGAVDGTFSVRGSLD